LGSTLSLGFTRRRLKSPMGEDKYNMLNMVMKAIRQTRMVLISTQPCYVTYRSSFSDATLNVLRFNGTGHYQRRNDEVSPWHEAFVNAKNGLTKINYFDLYIESVLERRFFLSLNYFGRDHEGQAIRYNLSSRFKTRREGFPLLSCTSSMRCYPNPSNKLSSLYRCF
jgi:hypothetical protein